MLWIKRLAILITGTVVAGGCIIAIVYLASGWHYEGELRKMEQLKLEYERELHEWERLQPKRPPFGS